jgi:hypothetical protein
MQWSISSAGGRESPLTLLEGSDLQYCTWCGKDRLSGAEGSVLFYAFRELFRRYEISALEHIEENVKPFASWKKDLIVVVSYPYTV